MRQNKNSPIDLILEELISIVFQASCFFPLGAKKKLFAPTQRPDIIVPNVARGRFQHPRETNHNNVLIEQGAS